MKNQFSNPFYAEDMRCIYKNISNKEKLNKTQILITGANGLIASYIVDALMWMNINEENCIEVYALCRNQNKAEKRFEDYLNNPHFHLVIQDVCEPIKINEKFDFIIHAACSAHPKAYSLYPVETMRANIIGTDNLLRYAVQTKSTTFLFISSSEIYGENYKEEGLKEESFGNVDFFNVRACYFESKRVAETMCLCYEKEYGLNSLIVRPGYIYGAMITEENTRADAQFLRNALNNEEIVMKSKGEQVRSYEYVADAASAILTVLTSGKSGEAYNIASDISNASIYEFASMIAKVAGTEIKFQIPDEVEKQGYSKVKNSILNVEKIKKLGWNSQYSLQKGVQQMINVCRKGNE